jgi:protein MpaA
VLEWLTEILGDLRAAAGEKGFAEEVYGEVEGWPLVAFSRESPGAPVVYLSSGMHGDEPAGVEALLEILRSGLLDDRFTWRLCPLLNPTGLALGTRENFEGEDLNRDYLSLRSEEVRAHCRWLDLWAPPTMLLSLHEDWESSGFYYYEIALQDRPSCYEGLRKAAETVIPMEATAIIDEHATREPGWIYHPARPDRAEEWPEAIYLAEQGCPHSYTLETPSSRPREERVRCHFAVVEFLLADLAKRAE